MIVDSIMYPVMRSANLPPSVPQVLYPAPTLVSAMTPGLAAPGPFQDGVVVGLVGGQTAADVEFSVTAPAGAEGQTVQLRVVSQTDGSQKMPWTTLGVVSGGQATGTLSVQRSTGWNAVQMRYAASPSYTWEDTTAWGVGYKVLAMGQSQMGIMLSATDNGFTMSAGEDTASYYSNQSGDSFGLINNGTASDGLRALVQQYRVFDADTPLMIVREAIPGTGTLDFVDDSRTIRSFEDMRSKVDAYGGDYAVVLSMWPTDNSADFGGDAEPEFRIALGDTSWIASSAYAGQVDHTLADVLDPGYRLALQPATRHNYGMAGYRQSQVEWANALNLPVGPALADYRIGDGDTAHPANEDHGNVRFGARMAITLAKALGMAVPENPTLDGTCRRSDDGRYLIVPLTMRNGGSAYCPEPTDVRGFYVSENGGPPSNTGFVANLVGNEVRLAKTTGTWAASCEVQRLSEIEINSGGDGPTEDAIVAGELYETWAGDILGLGIPVHGQYVTPGVWELPARVQTSASTPDAGTASSPDTFEPGDWSIEDAGTGGTARVTINRLPMHNGAAINDVRYRIGSGSWVSTGGVDSFDIPDLTDGQQVSITLRAANEMGASGASDAKTVTTTQQAPAPILVGAPTAEAGSSIIDNGDGSYTLTRTGASNGVIRAYWPIDTATHGTALSITGVVTEQDGMIAGRTTILRVAPTATGPGTNIVSTPTSGVDGNEVINVSSQPFTAQDATESFIQVVATQIPPGQSLRLENFSVVVQ